MTRIIFLSVLVASATLMPELAHAKPEGTVEGIVIEPWDENCKDGGIRHYEGIDKNHDGSISPDEYTREPRYECTGLQIERTYKAPRSVCPHGGIVYHVFPKDMIPIISGDIPVCKSAVAASVPASLDSWLAKRVSGQNEDSLTEALAVRRTVDRRPGFTVESVGGPGGLASGSAALKQ